MNYHFRRRSLRHLHSIPSLVLLAGTIASGLADPVIKETGGSIYALVPDPIRMAFAPDGTLYTGRDASGSGGGSADAVKIHRIGPGGSPVTEFGSVAISDPDALIVDVEGVVSGTPGAVLVGGVHNNGSTGKVVKIAPDGTVTTLFGPSASLWNPSQFIFEPGGRLLFSENNSGKIMATTGGTPVALVSLAGANGLALDASGRLVVSSSSDGVLRLYAADGTLLNGSFATVAVGSPLARGPGGVWGTDLYAVAANGDLLRLGLQGGTTNHVGSGFGNVSDLQFGPDGALYASEFSRDRIYRFAPPTVPGAETSVHARVTDPVRLSFAPDGTLYVGRDNSGSGGDFDDAVKIHRIGPGGGPVGEYGNTTISDPDGVFYDTTGQFSGTPGAVIVGGVQLNASTGKLVKILPDGTVASLYGPTSFGFNPNLFVLDEVGGRLLFSDDIGGRIWTMTNGTPFVLFSLASAFALGVDSQGRILAGGSDSWLRLYSPAGVLLNASYLPAQTNTCLARGPGGAWGTDLYFIGTNQNLMRVTPKGEVITVGTSFGSVNSLAFGPDGALYASQSEGDLVWRIGSPEVRPSLTVTSSGSDLHLSWSSAPNRSYQLQSATALPATDWLNEGAPLPGNGGVLSTNFPSGPQPGRFFRLRVSN